MWLCACVCVGLASILTAGKVNVRLSPGKEIRTQHRSLQDWVVCTGALISLSHTHTHSDTHRQAHTDSHIHTQTPRQTHTHSHTHTHTHPTTRTAPLTHPLYPWRSTLECRCRKNRKMVWRSFYTSSRDIYRFFYRIFTIKTQGKFHKYRKSGTASPFLIRPYQATISSISK